MASVNEPCCGHGHVGGDELWMSVDDIIDLIRATTWATVREMLSADRAEAEGEPRPLESSEREAIRSRYDELQRQRKTAREPPAQRRTERIMWGPRD